MLDAVFVLCLCWFEWILRSSLFRPLGNVQSLSMCACPERTILLGRTRCEENSEEYCSDVGRSLLLFGFPTQAWRSVACSWFRLRRSCFCNHHMGCSVPSFSLGARDLSCLLLQLEWTRRLRRLGFRTSTCETALPRCLRHRREQTMAVAAASVVSSRGVCGGVVALRFTFLFPLTAMFASLQCSG